MCFLRTSNVKVRKNKLKPHVCSIILKKNKFIYRGWETYRKVATTLMTLFLTRLFFPRGFYSI